MAVVPNRKESLPQCKSRMEVWKLVLMLDSTLPPGLALMQKYYLPKELESIARTCQSTGALERCLLAHYFG
jgi:hypothetical protein